nr:hypothetical protein [Candidatus Levybacteria bacterium]
MSEWFFPEVKFHPPKPPEASHVPASVKPVVQMEQGEEYVVRDQPGSAKLDVVNSAEAWTEGDILLDHRNVLKIVSDETSAPLTLKRRWISFVPRQELITSPVDRHILASIYGEDALMNFIAYCRRLPDNKFNIRLGYKGVESRVKKKEVAAVNAHEHGHTIGPHLTDPVAEEMKADAFESLYMGYYLGTVRYFMDGTNPRSVHHISRSRIRQLQEIGIREEEIIAHLIGGNFGDFNQDSYKRHLRRPFTSV